jgi:tetratricopeptide (TPR) repeat protein
VGEKDCLQSLKVQLLSALGDFDQASAVNEKFVAANPSHSLGLEQRAVLLASQGKAEEAYESLQNGMDHLPGSQIPVNFATAFRAVAAACIQNGAIWAARAHATFAGILKEEEATSQLLEWIEMGSKSLFLKRSNALRPAPEHETEWKKKYENAIKASRRGQFRKAIQLIQKALEIEPQSSFLRKAMALAVSNQPNSNELVARWHAVAACDDLPMIQRVEAEAIAQMFTSIPTAGLAIQRIVFEFDCSADEISEAAQSSRRFITEEPDPAQLESEGPPPRDVFLFLDRDALDYVRERSIDQIPVVIGQCMLFGKQTDRAARIEILLAQRDNFEQYLQDFANTFSGKLRQVKAETMGSISAFNDKLEINWHLPPTVDRETFMRLEKSFQFHNATNVLPDLKIDFLGGRTLRELAATPEGQLSAQAVLLKFEMSLDGRQWSAEWTQRARDAVGLPSLPTASIQDLELADSPFELLYSDISQLPNQQLAVLFIMASSLFNATLIRRVGRMLLERNGQIEGFGPELIHISLAGVETDDDICFQHLAQAREIAQQSGREVGNVLVAEFEQRLLRGKTNGMRRIIQEVQRKHLNEPGVGERLAGILSKYGMITSDGRIFLPPEDEGESAKAKTGLWTPEASGSSAAIEGAGSGESKLWIPGQ